MILPALAFALTTALVPEYPALIDGVYLMAKRSYADPKATLTEAQRARAKTQIRRDIDAVDRKLQRGEFDPKEAARIKRRMEALKKGL